MKFKYARWFTLAAAFIIVCIGLVLNTNLGTLSSFGWQAIATVCPLGVIESALAAKTIFPRALIVLLVVVVLIVLLGKVFCSWICPVAPVNSLVNRIRENFRLNKLRPEVQKNSQQPTNMEAESTNSCEDDAAIKTSNADPLVNASCDIAQTVSEKACDSNCSNCASKRSKLDSRHLVLGGSLLSALLFGFPVFCLLCPIGLIFGTVIIIWQFIGFEDVSLSLLIYPLILIIELVVLRKWCSKFCPLGALVSLLSLPNRFFKPTVNSQKCLQSGGGNCHVCSDVCPEKLDPHYSCSMHECSKCGICKDKCPTKAISFAILPKS